MLRRSKRHGKKGKENEIIKFIILREIVEDWEARGWFHLPQNDAEWKQ